MTLLERRMPTGRRKLFLSVPVLGALGWASVAWACTLVMVGPIAITASSSGSLTSGPTGTMITVAASGLDPLAKYNLKFAQPCTTTTQDVVCAVADTFTGGHDCMSGTSISANNPYTPTAGSIIGATGTIPTSGVTTGGEIAQICFAPDPLNPGTGQVGSGSAYFFVT